MGKVLDRVVQTSTSEGTGSFELTGTVSGYNSFIVGAGVATSDTIGPWLDVNYQIEQRDSGGSIVDWEIGTGTLYKNTGDTPFITRDTVTSSSNGGALVDFGSGTKNIWNAPQSSNFNSIFTIDQTFGSVGGSGSAGAGDIVGYDERSANFSLFTGFDFDHSIMVIAAPVNDDESSFQWLPTSQTTGTVYLPTGGTGDVFLRAWNGFPKVHHALLDFGSGSSGNNTNMTATLPVTLNNYQKGHLHPNFIGNPNIIGDARIDNITRFSLASNTTARLDCDLNDAGTVKLCVSIIEF